MNRSRQVSSLGDFCKMSPIRADWTSTVSVCLWFLSLATRILAAESFRQTAHRLSLPVFVPSPPLYLLFLDWTPASQLKFWQKLIFLSLSFQPPTLIFTRWSTAYSNPTTPRSVSIEFGYLHNAYSCTILAVILEFVAHAMTLVFF